jgi:hypothetical protein
MHHTAEAAVWLQVVENQSLRDSFLPGSLWHIDSHNVGSYRNKNLSGNNGMVLMPYLNASLFLDAL